MVSVMLCLCIFCISLLYLFVLFVVCLTVFMNCLLKQFAMCLLKQFAMCLGVVADLLLNVMDVFSVGGGALLDRPCMIFHIMCVLCL